MGAFTRPWLTVGAPSRLVFHTSPYRARLEVPNVSPAPAQRSQQALCLSAGLQQAWTLAQHSSAQLSTRGSRYMQACRHHMRHLMHMCAGQRTGHEGIAGIMIETAPPLPLPTPPNRRYPPPPTLALPQSLPRPPPT